LLLLVATPVVGQETAALVGDRIRLRRHQDVEWVDGSLASFTGDSVRLVQCTRCTPLSYARHDLAAVEVRIDNGIRGRTVATTAVIGLVAGVTIAASTAARSNRGCRDGPCGLESIFLPPIGGAVGLAIGVGVGMSIRHGSWRPARLN